MPKQTDQREPYSTIGDEAGINTPPASPSEFQQELAEKIDAKLPSGEEIIEIDRDGNVSKPHVDAIAAVLAAAQVVDPERFYASNRAIADLEQQLAALRGDSDE